MNKKIRIGLPKGNLIKYSAKIASDFSGEPINPRRLSFDLPEYELFFLKMRDIPPLVASGMLDFGITCEEWTAECGVKVETFAELDWCDTRISLIAAVGRDELFSRRGNLTCATEYPNIAGKYFEKCGHDVNIIHISGSSEAFVPMIYDCCIDCVETMSTVTANSLLEADVIIRSKIVLISASRDIQLPPSPFGDSDFPEYLKSLSGNV